MSRLTDKLFGTHSQREIKRIRGDVDRIESLRPAMQALTDEELRAKTDEFKKRVQDGESLDSILPEAYAAVREGARRALDMEPFRVQLIGGIILHQGRIAEMRTGEGKTLVATMPAYLNALEIEAFIHGAMCISYSGRCLLSAWFTGRDANRGACTHPCRWKYAVAEETRPGEYFPIEENERGTYIFNSRDLCMIGHLPELAGAGVDSLKIEGRMKTALYVASITRAYRRAIDDYLESEEKYEAGMDWYMREIKKCTYRDFTTGFYFGKPDTLSMVYTDNTYASDAVFLGIIEDVQPACGGMTGSTAADEPAGKDSGHCIAVIHQKNKFAVGDLIEIMQPDGTDKQAKVVGMWNAENIPVHDAPHPGELIRLELDVQAKPGDIIRTAK